MLRWCATRWPELHQLRAMRGPPLVLGAPLPRAEEAHRLLKTIGFGGVALGGRAVESHVPCTW